MIAARDVGEKVAELLAEERFRQPRVRELLGPGDYTMAEATRILGAAIGTLGVRHVQCSYDDARGGMLSMGLSAGLPTR
jgi:uncharacterized protein YbjT (DUF2867 family)